MLNRNRDESMNTSPTPFPGPESNDDHGQSKMSEKLSFAHETGPAVVANVGWWYLGVATISILTMVAVMRAVVKPYSTVVAGNCTVDYLRRISPREAQLVADSLSEGPKRGYFHLDRIDDVIQITWFVKNPSGHTDETLATAASIGWWISSEVFDLNPVQVRVITESQAELGIAKCFIAGARKCRENNLCILYSESVTVADVERFVGTLSKYARSNPGHRNTLTYLDHRNGEYIIQVIHFFSDLDEKMTNEFVAKSALATEELSKQCFAGAKLSLQYCDARMRPFRIIVTPSVSDQK
jgi:hypothetical protein